VTPPCSPRLVPARDGSRPGGGPRHGEPTPGNFAGLLIQLPWNELAALREYDRLGADQFFSQHGCGPAGPMIWDERHCPHKAILGTAYEIAIGLRLAPGDFEGGKGGAVRVLSKLGFTAQPLAQGA
jgi:hypothetical protein